MPELAEVEIARENLDRWLTGRRVVSARVLDSRMVRDGGSVSSLERRLCRASYRAASRRGKYLLLDFETLRQESFTVLVHLAMSGKFVHCLRAGTAPRSAAVVLTLEDEREVVFVNPRRLGHFRILQPQDRTRLARLGVDPLDPSFTAETLRALLAGSRRPLKPFLMDQRNVAGLGNIQVTESLFIARLAPTTPCDRLTAAEVSVLRRSIVRSLARTLRATRSEEVRYVQDRGSKNPFLVYGKANEACPRCETPIHRTIQAGRSTFHCPDCQTARPDRPRAAGRRK